MGHSLHLLVELVILFVILIAFGIRTSWFQTYLAQETASCLSKQLGKEITIDKVDLIFFDELDIKGVYIQDSKEDTLLYTSQLNATIADWSLNESFVNIENILLADATVKMRIYEGDTVFNFQYLLDYFASDEVDTTESAPFDLTVNTLTLQNVNFLYQDQNAEVLPNGFDYANIDLKQINGDLSNFALIGDSVLIDINHFSFVDRSGLNVREFNTSVLYSPKLISLKDLNINLNQSVLRANHFELAMPNGTSDFDDFLNNVRFNAELRHTTLALSDVAYFVPDLWGMTDKVNIVNLDISGPVNGMKLKNTEIRMLDTTLIKGDFQIPNLDDINNAFIDERIEIVRTSISDIEKLNLLPFLDGEKHIDIPSNLDIANVVTLKNGHFTGVLSDFVVDGDITSGLGNIYSENGLKFTKNETDGLYYYQGTIANGVTKDIIVENLDLGALASNSMLGKTSGYLKIKKGTKGFAPEDIDLNFMGHFSSTTLNGYTYHDIIIKEGRYNDDRFTGVVDVEDDNLALNYDGYIDFKNDLIFNFDIKVDSSFLARMKLFDGDLATNLRTKMNVNISGTSLDNIKGNVTIENFEYFDGEKEFKLGDSLTLAIIRSDSINKIELKSSLVDIDFQGDFNFNHLIPVLKNQVGLLLTNYIDQEEIPKDIEQSFDFSVEFNDINPLLDFFGTQTYLQPNSTVWASYSLEEKKLDFNFKSDSISYQDKAFTGISLSNNLDSTRGSVYYFVSTAKINDSISIRNLYLDSYIKPNKLFTNLGWDGNDNIEPALFAFSTKLNPNKDIVAEFFPSFFYLKGEKWEINPQSTFLWNPELIQISGFDIVNNDQLISFNGKVSKNPSDWLNFRIKDFDLSALNKFLGGDLTLGGQLNIDGGLADVYDNIRFMALTGISDFIINDEEVGDILVDGRWDKVTNSVKLNGNLKRDKKETFTFNGDYYVEKEENSLDIFLSFGYTDISFLNAFADEDLYTEIEGILNGDLHIGGEPSNPIINGDLDVVTANVKVPMFNVAFGLSGQIGFGEGEIIADDLTLYDQEGNTSITMMQIYHYDWTGWNYDITLDMADPNITQTFLVMDTKYHEGDVYYGKAYITGDVNISGYNGMTAINVNAKTEKGTALILPLYGTSELEQDNFIEFYDPNDTTVDVTVATALESMGMTLSMNFEVTNEAEVKIVFDPVFNDEIVANGDGNIEITMDEYGEMEMYGKFTIHDGVYHMNMKNIVAEDFEIVDGSTVVWTQSPYDANIDIKTRFERSVDMSDIMTSSLSTSSRKDQVFGYLNLSNTLMSPVLSFDIQAPKARDEAKKALNQIRGVEDELNKQFFALLMIKKFIPVAGSGDGSGGGNVATDLLNQQINGVLGQIGDNYDLKSQIGTDKVALGFQKSFLDDKLKVTTSVGVMSADEQSGGASSIVGDVNIEYELNDDGTFNVTVFNESNSNAADKDQGNFTQGVGLSYQESFNSRKDFKLWQGFLNVFRKKENKVHLTNGRKGGNGRKVQVQENFDPDQTEERE